jgi:recombinational DNA repair protein (RecF pathway)
VARQNQARICGDCAAFCLELLERSKSATFFEHHCASCDKKSVARAFKRLDNRHVCAPCMSNAAHMLKVTVGDGLITAHYANPIPVEALPPPFGLARLFPMRQELTS